MKKVIILLIKKIKSFFPNKLKTQIKKIKRFNGNGLDKKMLNYINYKNGFFIECGANDGVNQSVTWYFERALKWRGLLIEPIKEIFEELKKNRNKNNFFFNTALGSYKCKKKITLHIDENDFLTTRSTLDDKKRENKFEEFTIKIDHHFNNCLKDIEKVKENFLLKKDKINDEYKAH